MLLLKGRPNTFNVASVDMKGRDCFVLFRGNDEPFRYNTHNVQYLKDYEKLDPGEYQVYCGGVLQYRLIGILRYEYQGEYFYRLIREDREPQEFVSKAVHLVPNCLRGEKCKDILEYLREVSGANTVETDGEGEEDDVLEQNFCLLKDLYLQLSEVGADTSAACYLNPDKYPIKQYNPSELIYPFGINVSQKLATERAFSHQLSLIQGPPGTGKTQTILNILANIILSGKTALVVSNNNSAIDNIQEKFAKSGLDFVVARLGSNAHKDAFIANQPLVPNELNQWGAWKSESSKINVCIGNNLSKLTEVFCLQEEQARLKAELQALELEWKHYCYQNNLKEDSPCLKRVASTELLRIWLQIEVIGEEKEEDSLGGWQQLKKYLRRAWFSFVYSFKLRRSINSDSLASPETLISVQILYYQNKLLEIKRRLQEIAHRLTTLDATKIKEELTEKSMQRFKLALYHRYHGNERPFFSSYGDINSRHKDFSHHYPIVLSTTFSARRCMPNGVLYDFVIMDEASQVSIDAGFLAMTCAKQAVVVGDNLQLANIVTDKARIRFHNIIARYHIHDAYDCAKHSFLRSLGLRFDDIPETLLREHYRCHPKIINYCNQKFYGGQLLIMTEDKGEEDVLLVVKTVPGNHSSNRSNLREVEVVRDEILPELNGFESVGVITPYKNQVELFSSTMNTLEVATVHKYQGRERNAIIMSVVDNQISSFADDPQLLNVAVSRAKSKFCLVVTGNEQSKLGNIQDLIDYIIYNNGIVKESKISSVFDQLYEQYTDARLSFLKKHSYISSYDSENIAYGLVAELLSSDERFSSLSILCHVGLRSILQDTSLLQGELLDFALHRNTHIDLLISSKVSKRPILAIEIDGYSYHNIGTEQYSRDLKKDQICQLYSIPLLRLSTKGSRELEQIRQRLLLLLGNEYTDAG